MKTDLKKKTKGLALRIIKPYVALPKTTEAQVLGKQVLRSGTSVGAHYHEVFRSRSNAEFICKIEGGLQELDETIYWLELLVEACIVRETQVTGLLAEANELIAIFVTCVKNTKDSRPKKPE
jgi:four helix bundle protein